MLRAWLDAFRLSGDDFGAYPLREAVLSRVAEGQAVADIARELADELAAFEHGLADEFAVSAREYGQDSAHVAALRERCANSLATCHAVAADLDSIAALLAAPLPESVPVYLAERVRAGDAEKELRERAVVLLLRGVDRDLIYEAFVDAAGEYDGDDPRYDAVADVGDYFAGWCLPIWWL